MWNIFKRGKDTVSKKILMIDKNNKVINSFCSTREAARYLVETFHKDPKSEGGYSSHISEVCRGIRKSCLGYKWQYAEAYDYSFARFELVCGLRQKTTIK